MTDIGEGYILLYRQLRHCWVWKEKPFSKGQAWVDLLFFANHRKEKIPINHVPTEIDRGQFHTSIDKLSVRWGWDKRKVSRFLNNLEMDGMLTQNRTPNGTTLTIVNYDSFRVRGTTDGYTDGTSDSTSDSTPDGTQTKNEERIIKNKKKTNNSIVKHKYGEYENVLLSDEEYQKLINEFPGDYQQRIENLSIYMKSKGKTYKDHLATIRNWARKESKEQNGRNDKRYNTTHSNEYDSLMRQLANPIQMSQVQG